MMDQRRLLICSILLAIFITSHVPAAVGWYNPCPSCEGSVLDPLGCCETVDACTAPTSKAACDLLSGKFFMGDMICDSETRCEKSTAIRLSSFNVSKGEGSNLIVWSTGAEIDTEGFHILRSTSSIGPYNRITPSMVASTGGGFSRGRYSFVDASVEEGKSYYYKLEEVDTRGKLAQYGPLSAVAKAKEIAVRSEQLADQKIEDIQQQTPTPLPSPLKGEGEVESVVRSTYTIVAYADGPVKFLSGETVDDERVAGIINEEAGEQKVEAESQMSEVRGKKSEVRSQNEEKTENSSDDTVAKNEIASASPRNDGHSPESIQFRIIDAEGNEVAIASVEGKGEKSEVRSQKLDKENQDYLKSKRYADRIELTWYASEPVKGFHILRSTKKDGEYQKITKTVIPYLSTGQDGKLFKYNYVDAKVEKGKEYYYKIEIISNMENKTALR
ncbi:MAG: hypothetical protein HZA08_04085 [Nitrospirae bacterium]|nr:hypothetical protein [Nitrospirota bacterium]